MEIKTNQSPNLTHEERLERLQRLCANLQQALDKADEQRRLLRDVARTAAELAESLESGATHDHTIDRRRSSRKAR